MIPRITKLFQILLSTGDLADDLLFTRQSQLLRSLYVRRRHHISTITDIQNNAKHQITRVNSKEIYIYKRRNNTDLEALKDEVSAVVDNKT